MRADPKTRELVKRLVALSLENGKPSTERVNAVLSSLRGSQHGSRLRLILKLYEHYMREEIRRGQAVIEHAGAISTDAVKRLTDSFTRRYSRPIEAKLQPNPALLAGVRVTIGDDVWDMSAAGRLAQLQNRLA